MLLETLKETQKSQIFVSPINLNKLRRKLTEIHGLMLIVSLLQCNVEYLDRFLKKYFPLRYSDIFTDSFLNVNAWHLHCRQDILNNFESMIFFFFFILGGISITILRYMRLLSLDEIYRLASSSNSVQNTTSDTIFGNRT